MFIPHTCVALFQPRFQTQPSSQPQQTQQQPQQPHTGEAAIAPGLSMQPDWEDALRRADAVQQAARKESQKAREVSE